VTAQRTTTPANSQLVLSLFPGIDLIGRGFEAEGFCVVRGPDIIWGGDIGNFHPVRSRFDGIIAGSPCQDFSKARRGIPPTGYGVEMLQEFLRVVLEAEPDWFLLENVPTVPDVILPGLFTVQRFDLNSNECGSTQNRLRHFQFGSRRGLTVSVRREKPDGESQPPCLASDGKRKPLRSFADFCVLQGLPPDFDLPGWSREFKYKAVGNGVNVLVARVVARAIREATFATEATLTNSFCICGCGRPLTGKQKMATAACRKRMQHRRECSRSVTARSVTVGAESQF